jgi:hypothetical protein
MLHLLNGDATAAVFPDALPGERAVCDILMEGPARAGADARAAWLAPRLGVTEAAYARGWREGEATLARASEHDEVVLWFEQDLFCATNLWFVLDRLATAPRVSLVFPPLADGFDGLGTLGATAFVPLFERRERLDRATRDEAQALWRAYAAHEPTDLAGLGGRLPFAREAVRLHCGRFPSRAHGLDEVEHATLAALEGGPRPFPELFREVTRAGPLRAYGLGDVQLALVLRELRPLVDIGDATATFGGWRPALTAAGGEVLAGRADGVGLRALDRWIGGVHLRAGAAGWRRDGTRLIPV